MRNTNKPVAYYLECAMKTAILLHSHYYYTKMAAVAAAKLYTDTTPTWDKPVKSRAVKRAVFSPGPP